MNCGRGEVERAGKYVAWGRRTAWQTCLHGGPPAPQAGMDADGAGG